MNKDNNELMGNSKEVKTVSLKKSAFIVFGLLLIVLVLMLTIHGCTVSKKVETEGSGKNSSEVVLAEDDQTSQKETEKSENFEVFNESVEKSSSTVVKGEGKEGEFNEKNSSESSAEKVESSSDSVSDNSGSNEPEDKSEGGNDNSSNYFFKVDEPALGESAEVSTLVSGKDVYLVDRTSYTYCLNLIFPVEGGYEILRYFCPKKTYDAVSSGDTVNASYQLDEKGRISITSISR